MHNFPILYVEDEEFDVFFLKHAFEGAGIKNPFNVVSDGQQAIDYLCGSGSFSDRKQFPLPGLVLLDLKLPCRSGLEVLQWIRQQSDLRRLLVVVYTSSTQPRDINAAYEAGASGYLVKQSNPERLDEMVRVMREYWLIHNEPSPPQS